MHHCHEYRWHTAQLEARAHERKAKSLCAPPEQIADETARIARCTWGDSRVGAQASLFRHRQRLFEFPTYFLFRRTRESADSRNTARTPGRSQSQTEISGREYWQHQLPFPLNPGKVLVGGEQLEHLRDGIAAVDPHLKPDRGLVAVVFGEVCGKAGASLRSHRKPISSVYCWMNRTGSGTSTCSSR